MVKLTLLLSLFFTTSLSSAEPIDERSVVIEEIRAALMTECGDSGLFVFYDVKVKSVDYKVHRAVFKKGYAKLVLSDSVDPDLEEVDSEPVDEGNYEYKIHQIKCL